MRSSDNRIKTSELNLHWDKNAESYIKDQDYSKSGPNIVRNLEEYLDFLEEIKPALIDDLHENQRIDKQFILFKN